jgi:hypothetical protein
VTVYQTLLARGYFPKELPPAFFTEQFANYCVTRRGRALISAYSPADNFTECLKYRLALPGLDRRELRIPHPASFAKLADLTAANLSRLLSKASGSGFSRSRPVYSGNHPRSIHPTTKPGNLSRERAAIRAGSSYLLKTDISQFYPSLYTHAVGWAIDPTLRLKANWQNGKLLGKKLDQALMNLDGKVSQGVPIGNDISYLLAEAVLTQVDKAVRVAPGRAFRWFDDYELAFDTVNQAEEVLKKLNRELGKFRLRLNSKKTAIVRLPRPAQDEWQETLKQAGKARFSNPREMVTYFDIAFRLREQFPEEPVLLYALGILFKIGCPRPDVARIAQSCLTQAVLCEPGSSQKAFALLAFWQLNGLTFDAQLITNTINQMIIRHQSSGFSSDIAWALAFCLEQRCTLSAKAGQVLSGFDDDCIALQALHMGRVGLLPKGFSDKHIARALKNADLDREHWLLAYEAVRHNFLTVSAPAVKGNSLFSELLKQKVTFYQTKLPAYASVVHHGGAPDWIVRKWLLLLKARIDGHEPEADLKGLAHLALLDLIWEDLRAASERRPGRRDIVGDLMMQLGERTDALDADAYS